MIHLREKEAVSCLPVLFFLCELCVIYEILVFHLDFSVEKCGPTRCDVTSFEYMS